MSIDQTKGKYLGELRKVFNVIEQWDGLNWVEPPERGRYDMSSQPVKLHFDVEDALHD